jgi:CHRD domain/PEP-CTERM motif
MTRNCLIALCISTAAITASPASSAIVVATANLSGLNEVPAIVTPATGTTTVTFDNVAHTLRVQESFTGLIGNTTASHIHCCVAPGASVGVATTLPNFPLFPLGVTSGTYDRTFDTTLASTFSAAFLNANGGTPAGAEAALFNGIVAGNAYINIHTSFAPGGELRGLLSPAPEPSTWAMMLVGFAGVGVAIRRRRKCEALASA